MNDVLPKPFTKEGMLRSLEKHLPQFKKNPAYPSTPQMPHPGGFVTTNPIHPPLGLNMGQLSTSHSLKDETSPGKSPATVTSWQSPSQQQLPGQSPVGGPPQGYMQQPIDSRHYAMTPSHSPSSFLPPQNPGMGAPRSAAHRRVMSDMTGGAPDGHQMDKRQRMYPPQPPQQGGYAQ